MQAFRLRGIYARSARFFSQDALCWPDMSDELPPVSPVEVVVDKTSGAVAVQALVFGNPSGLTRAEKQINGQILRRYARRHAGLLGLDPDPALAPQGLPQVASFHPTFRIASDGSLRLEMVVEIVQTRRVPFDASLPEAGSFPMRGGATLILSAPALHHGVAGDPTVRFAICKPLVGDEAEQRLASQRDFSLALGMANGDTDDPRHFQADFNLLHGGFKS
jgi:hypothetical protein